MLTAIKSNSNLPMPLTHSAVGRENPNNSGLKAAFNAVFYCPPKTNTGLVRVQNVMTGCYRRLSSLPVPEFGILTLFQSVAHSVRRVNDGLQSNSGVSHMTSFNTQKPHNNSVSDTENQLIELSQIIGSVADTSHSFSYGVAEYIHYLDKSLSTLTLPELVEIINEYREAFNYPKTPPKKSLFNVIDKSKKLIAKRVPYEQARQYPDALIKFDCMAGGAS